MNIIIEQYIDNMLKELDIRYQKISYFGFGDPHAIDFNIISVNSDNRIVIHLIHACWSMTEKCGNMGTVCFGPSVDMILERCSKYMPMRKL